MTIAFDTEHPLAALVVATDLPAREPCLGLAPAEIELCRRCGTRRRNMGGLSGADALGAAAQTDIATGPVIDRHDYRHRAGLYSHVGGRSSAQSPHRNDGRERNSKFPDHRNPHRNDIREATTLPGTIISIRRTVGTESVRTNLSTALFARALQFHNGSSR